MLTINAKQRFAMLVPSHDKSIVGTDSKCTKYTTGNPITERHSGQHYYCLGNRSFNRYSLARGRRKYEVIIDFLS